MSLGETGLAAVREGSVPELGPIRMAQWVVVWVYIVNPHFMQFFGIFCHVAVFIRELEV